MLSNPAFCFFEGADYWIFSSNVPSFIYYTHLTALVLSLAISLFVYFVDRKNLVNRILFWSLVPFLLWVFFNIIIWSSNRSDIIMFLWSLQIMIEPLVYIGMLYLIYVFINKRDVAFKIKIIVGILYLPLIVITPTAYSLPGFDLSLCFPIESYYSYYTYVLELLSVILISVYTYHCYRKETDKNTKKQILFLAIGVILFLITFASGNIFGSITDNWVTSQFGLFGAPILAAFIAYLVVRFQAFKIKLIGTQVLVGALWIAIMSILFINKIENVRVVVSATLIIFLLVGMLLIRSVKREIGQREKIENLAKDLEKVNENLTFANERQENLIHFINHQVKGFFTKSKYIFSTLMEGDYGRLDEKMETVIKEGLRSDNEGIAMVGDILNASNIKSGVIKYNKSVMDFKELVLNVASEQKKNAEDKGLLFKINVDESDYKISGDDFQLKHVVKNLVDNSIKYTPTGKVTMSLSKTNGKILFSVKDTGVGLTKEDKQRLFTEGGKGKNSQKINVNSTGFGLFIAKNIVLAHNGKIWAESEGEGKGSQFYVELVGKTM